MDMNEFNERLDGLKKRLGKAMEGQRKAQDTGDHPENVRQQTEIGALDEAIAALMKEARDAGLPV